MQPNVQPEQIGISVLSALYGVSLRTLRFYEDKGLITPIRLGTARYYTAKDKIRLEMILKGKRLGFSLAEIETLIAATPPSKQSPDGDDTADITECLDLDQITAKIRRLERQRDELQTSIDELQSSLNLK